MRPNKKSKRDIDSQPFPIKFFFKKKKRARRVVEKQCPRKFKKNISG